MIQQNVTDNPVLRDIFNVELEFRHYEREIRQLINYDLDVGFDERHFSNNSLSEMSEAMTSTYPYENTIQALATDTYSEIASVIYIWRYIGLSLKGIAENTNFGSYWDTQKTKLAEFVTSSPVEDDLKGWISTELI